jgi:hypothetical protein
MPEPTMITQVPSKEQISAIVNLCTEGLLNIVMGQNTEDKLKEMNEEHDKMLEIVNAHKIPAPNRYQSPREQIIAETKEANDHVRSALSELEKAQKLSKCNVCKETLGQTIDIVSNKTQEILDASEKVLVMQRLKEVGELPPDITWDDLNKVQKKTVENLVEKFRPVPIEDYFEEGGDLQNGEIKRKNPKPRKTQKPKPKARRK